MSATENKISIKTPMGELVAFTDQNEPEYPGICIALKEQNGYERILTLVEYQPGEEKGGLCGYYPDNPDEMAREKAEVPMCCRKGESGILPGLVTRSWPNPWDNEELYHRTFHHGYCGLNIPFDEFVQLLSRLKETYYLCDFILSHWSSAAEHLELDKMVDDIEPIPECPDGYTIINNVEIILPNSQPDFYKATGFTYHDGMVTEYVYEEDGIDVDEFVRKNDKCKFLATGKLHIVDEYNSMDINTELLQMDTLAGIIPGIPKGLYIACSCSHFERNCEKMSKMVSAKRELMDNAKNMEVMLVALGNMEVNEAIHFIQSGKLKDISGKSLFNGEEFNEDSLLGASFKSILDAFAYRDSTFYDEGGYGAFWNEVQNPNFVDALFASAGSIMSNVVSGLIGAENSGTIERLEAGMYGISFYDIGDLLLVFEDRDTAEHFMKFYGVEPCNLLFYNCGWNG